MSFSDVNDSINRVMGGMMDLFFPRKCPFCGAIVGKDLLCGACEKTLPWCEKERNGANFQRVTAPLFYEGAVREAVHDLKFNGKTGGLDCFGRMMAQCAAERYSGEFDAVTWVPVSKKRLKKRGYDQARLLCASLCVDWHVEPLETQTKENYAHSLSLFSIDLARYTQERLKQDKNPEIEAQMVKHLPVL